MKLILLVFTFFVCGNFNDVNSIPLDIKETKEPIDPPKTILIIGDSQSATKTKAGESITWTWPNHLQKKLKPYGVTIDDATNPDTAPDIGTLQLRLFLK